MNTHKSITEQARLSRLVKQWHAVACSGLKGAGWPVHSTVVPLLPLYQGLVSSLYKTEERGAHVTPVTPHVPKKIKPDTDVHNLQQLAALSKTKKKKKKEGNRERGKVCPIGAIFNILQSTRNIPEAWEDGPAKVTHEKQLWESLVRAGLESRDLRVTKPTAREQHSQAPHRAARDV